MAEEQEEIITTLSHEDAVIFADVMKVIKGVYNLVAVQFSCNGLQQHPENNLKSSCKEAANKQKGFLDCLEQKEVI